MPSKILRIFLALPACCGHARLSSCRLWRYRHGSKKAKIHPFSPPFRVKTTPTKIRSHTPTVFAEFVPLCKTPKPLENTALFTIFDHNSDGEFPTSQPSFCPHFGNKKEPSPWGRWASRFIREGRMRWSVSNVISYLIRHTQANFRMPPSPRGRQRIKRHPVDKKRQRWYNKKAHEKSWDGECHTVAVASLLEGSRISFSPFSTMRGGGSDVLNVS